MQNWEGLQHTANYDQHNNWYSSMFAASIKSEPNTSPIPSPQTAAAQLEHYLNMKQQQHQQQQQHQIQITAIESLNAMVPSPNHVESLHHFFDSTTLQQQFLHQQQHQQQQQQQQIQQQNYQQHFQTAATTSTISQTQHTLGFNPLTPPGLPSAVLPPMSHFYQHPTNMNSTANSSSNSSIGGGQQQSAGPHHITPPPNDRSKIEASLTPRNTPPMDVTPPKSPKQPQSIFSDVSINSITGGGGGGVDKDHDLMSNSSEDFKYLAESENDDESIRVPIYNSHGKMKNYKCKTCGLVAITKVSFWEHARSHMKPEKILQCSKCPFVTELKHHLEYHIRKHKNLKPFQCDKCSYSCVNKSMLNSHRKSHSSVYQYRCSDCDYATKYCHSFKLHLRKYDHKPGLVLDENGTPNPSVVIDVYGTRRGPKMKSGSSGGCGGGSNRRHHNHHHHQNHEKNLSLNCANKTASSIPGLKVPTTHLSAALQGIQMNNNNNNRLSSSSPGKSVATASNDLPAIEAQQQQQHNQQLSNLLPPLASILQQGHNMGFFPYWNLNLQMLAAAQQQAVLAQLSPSLRESALKNLQNQRNSVEDCLLSATSACDDRNNNNNDDEDDFDDDDDDVEMKFNGKAMDLTQSTPMKDEKSQEMQPPQTKDGDGDEKPSTPSSINSLNSNSSHQRRVIQLENVPNTKSALTSPERTTSKETNNNQNETHQLYEIPPTPTSCCDVSTTSPNPQDSTPQKTESSVATDSGNATTASANSTSSASSAASSSSVTAATNTSPSLNRPPSNSPPGQIYECKYCDIYFRDAVLYTIHMGYHSCDDVFKCNMCGEKCDGPVGLFVHMARNAHS